ncbi:MAG: alkaline phosphatase family protein, partial [Candidatus Heimdallarchaeota archaeon]|nr:alkaline phosphatase family protein [Candidatus Heimdallarchaeota archaeon]
LFHFVSLMRLLDVVPSRWWRKNVRRLTRLIAQISAKDSLIRKMATSSAIPYEILDQFSMPMKKLACEEGAMPQDTLFDTVRKAKRTFFFHGYPAYKVDIKSVVDRVTKEEKGGNTLIFLFIGDLDRIGHIYGPDSDERKDVLRKVDKGIQDIVVHLNKNYNDMDILIFGDHGMAEVKGYVDLQSIIVGSGLKETISAYFLDSTFARFWVEGEREKKYLINKLNTINNGHILNDEDIDKYQIRYPHNYFGDLIFALDNHYIIHPSFYIAEGYPPKGMHGYLPGCIDNESAALIYRAKGTDARDIGKIDMRRIHSTALWLMDLYDTKKSKTEPIRP